MTGRSDVPSWHKRLLYGLTNWGLFFAGAVNLAVGTWCAIVNQVGMAATSLTAGLVLLFAATIDRFESLKGLGVEAKTVQLDRKLEQADEALRRLKEVTELTGAALIDLNSKTGRWGTAPTPSAAYELAQKVRQLMTSQGSDSPAMRQALEPWVRIFCHDLTHAILAPLREALTKKLQELERERSRLPSPTNASDPDYVRLMASSREIGTFLDVRLRRIDEYKLEDYPDRLLKLVEDVPLGDDVLVPIRAKARGFAPSMLELRKNLELKNPEPWFHEIEGDRERQRNPR